MNAMMKSVPIGVNLTSTLVNDQKVQSSDAIINDTLQQVTMEYSEKQLEELGGTYENACDLGKKKAADENG